MLNSQLIAVQMNKKNQIKSGRLFSRKKTKVSKESEREESPVSVASSHVKTRASTKLVTFSELANL